MFRADATTRGWPREATVTWAIAAVVGAVNLALKLPGLDRQSLWLDEALTVAVASRPLGEIVARAAGNQNPPLYGIVMHFWIAAFGASETSIRFFPVLCSTLAAVGVFLLARRFSSLRAAFFAAILFTGANLHVQYAREARVYALVTLLATASSYAFLALVTRPSWRPATVLAAVNALLVHCHYVAAFAPVAQLLATAAYGPWRRRGGRHVAASLAATALSALPILPFAVWNAPRVGAYWLDAPTWHDLRHVLKRLAGERRLLYATLLLAFPIVGRALGAPRLDRGRVLYLALAAFVPVALAFAVAARFPIFLDRYLIYASPPLLLLFAEMLARVPLGVRGTTVVALVLVASLAPRALRESPKDDWRGLAAAVHAHHDAAAGGSVVVIAPAELPALAYYWDAAATGAADPGGFLRATGIVAVERAIDVDADTLGRVRAVAVVRTRLGAPDASALHAAGFSERRPWAAVQGLEVVAHERP